HALPTDWQRSKPHGCFPCIDRFVRSIVFPLYDNFCYGQVQLMVLLGLLVVHRLRARRADAMAGLLLSFPTLLKLYPIVLVVYLLLRRRWRATAWVAVGTMIGTWGTWLALGRGLVMVLPGASGLAGSPVMVHSSAEALRVLSYLPSVLTQQRGFLSLG